MNHPLDNPIWHALCGPHRAYAIRHGRALHYPREVAAFSAIAEDSAQAYADLAHDLPADSEARLLRRQLEAVPDGWVQVNHLPLLQMVASEFDGRVLDGPAFDAGGLLKLVRENFSWAYPAVKDFAKAVWPALLTLIGT